MAALMPSSGNTQWWTAIGVAAAGHAAAIAALLATAAATPPALPEPVMVVELAGAAPSAAPATSSPEQAIAPEPDTPTMNLRAPEIDTPLPPEPVALPVARPLGKPLVAPPPKPQAVAIPAAGAPAARLVPERPSASDARAGGGPVGNPKAKAAEADWYSQISAHLNRNKRYPREAKKAGEQGTPVVRFSVDRRGRVSNVSIVTSSGHELLDGATIDLLARVAPLPAMPREMARDAVTISLPIEYSLSRK